MLLTFSKPGNCIPSTEHLFESKTFQTYLTYVNNNVHIYYAYKKNIKKTKLKENNQASQLVFCQRIIFKNILLN